MVQQGVQRQGRRWSLGAKSPGAIDTMKYCAYKNCFLCIICLCDFDDMYCNGAKT